MWIHFIRNTNDRLQTKSEYKYLHVNINIKVPKFLNKVSELNFSSGRTETSVEFKAAVLTTVVLANRVERLRRRL